MEIEYKYRVETTTHLREKLLKNGFSEGKKKAQIDTYFIVAEKKNDGRKVYLRVREDKLKKTNSLDYHIVFSEAATKELEVNVTDAATTIEILQNLGLKVVCVVDKEREEYNRNGLKVMIDQVLSLGSFVEIEVEGEEQTSLPLIKEVATELGLTEKQRVKKEGYPDMLLKSVNRVNL
jgi:predicted adenylyl cyclase CyaB